MIYTHSSDDSQEFNDFSLKISKIIRRKPTQRTEGRTNYFQRLNGNQSQHLSPVHNIRWLEAEAFIFLVYFMKEKLRQYRPAGF